MPNLFLSINVNASPFLPSATMNPHEGVKTPIERALDKLARWRFKPKLQKRITPLLEEWYSNSTLDSVLSKWEDNPSPTANAFAPLHVLSYNVQGWGTRALEVMDLIFKVDSPVCVLSEVGQKWNSFKVPHFSSLYQQGTNQSGGVMLLVGKHLKAVRIDTDIENTVIADIVGLSEQIRIIGIYWPQGQTRDLNELTPFLIKGTILTGDFNATSAEWGSPSTDKRGALLKKWTEENDLTFVPTSSHSSKRSNRHIDLTFTNLTGVTNETIFYGTSDHWPTVLSSQTVGHLTHGVFPQVDWTAFETILVLLEDFWTAEQKKATIDRWYSEYVRFLAALKSRLTRWVESEKYRPSLPPSLIARLREVKRIRNAYYRERKKKGVGDEELRVLLRNVTRETQCEIFKYKESRWLSFLHTIQTSYDNQEKAFWKHLSRLYKPKTLPFSKLMTGNRVLSDEQEITKELYKYFSSLAATPQLTPSSTHDCQIEKEYKELQNMLVACSESSLERTTRTEIARIIKKMKGKKSAGHDMISNHMIKLLSPAYIECLVSCFNQWLREGKYPNCWKTAKIVTLNKLKAGVPGSNQTRPISLLATHSKIFEKVLLNRIRLWAEGNHLLPGEQSGFRAGCLLPTRVLSIYQEVRNNLAANAPTLAIYVDYEKAFDLVWHMGLLVKLQRLGIPTSLLKMINSWLDNRTAYISYGQTKSDNFNIGVGLPQGSALSPYIFIVYHCDLVKQLGAHSGHLFADDLSVLIRAPLQKSFRALVDYLSTEGTKVADKIATYSTLWKQPINVSKTVVQVFYSQVRKPTVDVTMLGQKLKIVDSFKYLGFTWTSKLSLKPTVTKSLDNIQKALGKLKWLRSKKALSKKVLRQCFFAYVFPHFAWTFPFFPLLPRTHQEALRRKFRVAIRLIHRAPFVDKDNIHQFTGESTLEYYVSRYIKKRLKKLSSSDLSGSLFIEDIFYWDSFRKTEGDGVGHLFNLKRVKRLIINHRPLLLDWLMFIENEVA